MHNRSVNVFRPQHDDARRRRVDRRTLHTYRKQLIVAERHGQDLLKLMEAGVHPRRQSRHEKFGPKADERRPDAEERAEVWSYGLGDLYLRLRGALDSTRALIALSRHSRGIGLAPLNLARPVMEAAADTHAYRHRHKTRPVATVLRRLAQGADSGKRFFRVG